MPCMDDIGPGTRMVALLFRTQHTGSGRNSPSGRHPSSLMWWQWSSAPPGDHSSTPQQRASSGTPGESVDRESTHPYHTHTHTGLKTWLWTSPPVSLIWLIISNSKPSFPLLLRTWYFLFTFVSYSAEEENPGWDTVSPFCPGWIINLTFVLRPIHIHIPIRYNVLHWVIEEASPREGKQLVRGHTARPRTEELPIWSCYLFLNLFICCILAALGLRCYVQEAAL